MAEYKADHSQAAHELEQEPIAPGEIVLGTVTGMDSSGRPLVDYANSPSGTAVAALSTVSISRQHLHRQVALLFADGDYGKPVIMGLIHSPLFAILEGSHNQDDQQAAEHSEVAEAGVQEAMEDEAREDERDEELVAHVDGDRVVIEGKEEITFKCGESSITLTRAGKILIRGKYLLSRSSGVNRILGGSVQVN